MNKPPYALPNTLFDGAVVIVRPTDLRNRVGMFLVGYHGYHTMSKPVPIGKVQDLICQFTKLDQKNRLCPRCGVGIDSDVDGDCGICHRLSDEDVIRLKPRLNQRLWDIVRYFRDQVHEAGLITNEEYAELAKDTKF